MYFSDISNSELAKYHNTIKNNFELPFTEMISSSLFKVETIISNKLYKVYPLFYCENITSTNPNDEIMENKCIICQHNKNTLFSFQSTKPITNNGRFSVKITPNGIVVYVYDYINDVSLSNAEIYIKAEQSNEVYEYNGFTDENGVFYISKQSYSLHNVFITALKIILSDGTVIVDYTRGE